ncbi:Ribosomal protein L17 [Candidatus Magnetoovum chiemensis]|nr:Ribosomal protein L17 [Candidatus Magnetoovum chiemensis]
MRHRVDARHFGRTANQRKALLKNLVYSLIIYESIETTIAKAKTIKGITEKMVTLAKSNDVHSKRLALSKIADRKAIIKLFDVIAPRFTNRNGGYLRIIKTRTRIKDRADMAVIEFIDYQNIKEQKLKKDAKGKS